MDLGFREKDPPKEERGSMVRKGREEKTGQGLEPKRKSRRVFREGFELKMQKGKKKSVLKAGCFGPHRRWGEKKVV